MSTKFLWKNRHGAVIQAAACYRNAYRKSDVVLKNLSQKAGKPYFPARVLLMSAVDHALGTGCPGFAGFYCVNPEMLLSRDRDNFIKDVRNYVKEKWSIPVD